MGERKKEKWMDSEGLLGNSVDVCLLKTYCYYKRKRVAKENIKIEFRCCTFPDNCNQKRRATMKKITLDYLKSKNNHTISSLMKRVKDTISKPSS
jgi:hypothetical protein